MGDELENERWSSFFTFLKKMTDLIIYNKDALDANYMIFFNELTTGRGDTRINVIEKKISAQEEVIKEKYPFSFYCISEEDQQKRDWYVRENGYLIGFYDDYLKKWESFKLLFKKIVLPVRKNIADKGNVFYSWSLLSNYLSPFTDVVIVDSYLFSRKYPFSRKELVSSNLEKILLELDNATPVKYNLTIYSYEGYGVQKLDRLGKNEIYDIVLEIKQRLKLKCSLELVFVPGKYKEHDRVIQTNYLNIRSGDSFNYFDSQGKVITKGTDIVFGSMADPDIRNAANIALANVSEGVRYAKKNFLGSLVFGGCENRLLQLNSDND